MAIYRLWFQEIRSYYDFQATGMVSNISATLIGLMVVFDQLEKNIIVAKK